MLGQRDDGYHALDTIFQTISLCDTIKISPTENSEIVLSCDDRSLPTDSHNLVLRAANVLRKQSGTHQGARVRLEKRIPTHAGLGGGSSDAAVTLMGLAKLWQLSTSRAQLCELGSTLGADVPFCFTGGTARGKGIGDRLETLADAPESFLLIIKPNADMSTADAYKALDERGLTSSKAKTILSRSDAKTVFDSQYFASLQNDFESVALVQVPEIERAKNALLRAGARAAMLAGSGSAVFGILDSEDAQRRAIQTIELETGWRVFPCKTVGRDNYQSALGDLSQLPA